jgi:hypothetical protein
VGGGWGGGGGCDRPRNLHPKSRLKLITARPRLERRRWRSGDNLPASNSQSVLDRSTRSVAGLLLGWGCGGVRGGLLCVACWVLLSPSLRCPKLSLNTWFDRRDIFRRPLTCPIALPATNAPPFSPPTLCLCALRGLFSQDKQAAEQKAVAHEKTMQRAATKRAVKSGAEGGDRPGGQAEADPSAAPVQ